MTTFIGDLRYGRCWKCNAPINEATAAWSMKKYGEELCYDCQPKKIEEVTKKWKNKEIDTARN